MRRRYRNDWTVSGDSPAWGDRRLDAPARRSTRFDTARRAAARSDRAGDPSAIEYASGSPSSPATTAWRSSPRGRFQTYGSSRSWMAPSRSITRSCRGVSFGTVCAGERRSRPPSVLSRRARSPRPAGISRAPNGRAANSRATRPAPDSRPPVSWTLPTGSRASRPAQLRRHRSRWRQCQGCCG